jgi:hypothetical protein
MAGSLIGGSHAAAAFLGWLSNRFKALTEALTQSQAGMLSGRVESMPA